MPLHDYQCECGQRVVDRFWATWTEVPDEILCDNCMPLRWLARWPMVRRWIVQRLSIGTPMRRMAGRVTMWGPVSVWDDATGDLVAGAGRAELPGRELFAGTPMADMDMVNPYLEPDHPGYHRNATRWREHIDLGAAD